LVMDGMKKRMRIEDQNTRILSSRLPLCISPIFYEILPIFPSSHQFGDRLCAACNNCFCRNNIK
jgi:hypothetical protein